MKQHYVFAVGLNPTLCDEVFLEVNKNVLFQFKVRNKSSDFYIACIKIPPYLILFHTFYLSIEKNIAKIEYIAFYS